tara:strand:+ start:185 stop:949 length:765 start_codon:yes stop_codon:yes gene_type:complete
METFGNEKNPKIFSCMHCSKEYKTKSGLWKHERKCKGVDAVITPGLITQLLQQNKEMQELLINQQEKHEQDMKEKDKQIQEIIPKIGNTTNKFNLNVFLTENCKDAINMQEFIDSLTISITDLNSTKDVGLLESVNNQIIRNLKELEINKRPIHCTDIKRDVMYIKDKDVWEKDTNNKILKSSIESLAEKQVSNFSLWEESNPQYMETTNGQNDYLKLLSNITKDVQKEEKATNKIIKKIGKHVSIGDQDVIQE